MITFLIMCRFKQRRRERKASVIRWDQIQKIESFFPKYQVTEEQCTEVEEKANYVDDECRERADKVEVGECEEECGEGERCEKKCETVTEEKCETGYETEVKEECSYSTVMDRKCSLGYSVTYEEQCSPSMSCSLLGLSCRRVARCRQVGDLRDGESLSLGVLQVPVIQWDPWKLGRVFGGLWVSFWGIFDGYKMKIQVPHLPRPVTCQRLPRQVNSLFSDNHWHNGKELISECALKIALTMMVISRTTVAGSRSLLLGYFGYFEFCVQSALEIIPL